MNIKIFRISLIIYALRLHLSLYRGGGGYKCIKMFHIFKIYLFINILRGYTLLCIKR